MRDVTTFIVFKMLFRLIKLKITKLNFKILILNIHTVVHVQVWSIYIRTVGVFPVEGSKIYYNFLVIMEENLRLAQKKFIQKINLLINTSYLNCYKDFYIFYYKCNFLHFYY